MLGRRILMDDLLREFLTATNESLDTVDNQLVRFEQDPNNGKILHNVFLLVHTIKGTPGLLGPPPRRTQGRSCPLRKSHRQPNRSLRSKCWKPTKSPTSRSASMWTRWSI